MPSLLSLPQEIRDVILETVILAPPATPTGHVKTCLEQQNGTVTIKEYALHDFPRPFHTQPFTALGLLLTNRQLHIETKICLQRLRPIPRLAITLSGLPEPESQLFNYEFAMEWACLPVRSDCLDELDISLKLDCEPTWVANIELLAALIVRQGRILAWVMAYAIDASVKRHADPPCQTRRNRSLYQVKCINVRIATSCDFWETVQQVRDEDDPLLSNNIHSHPLLSTWFIYRLRATKQYASHPERDRLRISIIEQALRHFHVELKDANWRIRRVSFWIDEKITSTIYPWGTGINGKRPRTAKQGKHVEKGSFWGRRLGDMEFAHCRD